MVAEGRARDNANHQHLLRGCGFGGYGGGGCGPEQVVSRVRQKMADEQTKIEAIKGFDANFQCLNFQFEIGKTYTQDGEIVLCENGFHAIEGRPLDVFNYYAAAGSRFAIVECSGDIARGPPPESKIASATITIKAELHLHDLIQRTVEWVTARAKPENGASATGYEGAASAPGYRGAASATGASSVAMASGIRGSVSGEKGCALFLVNRNPETGVIHHAWAGIVGRNGIKPNTFYTLDDKGTPKEAKA